MKIASTIRRNLGLTQYDLAKFVGGERSSLARAEKGERLLDADATLNLIALHNLQANILTDDLPGETIEPSVIEDFKYHALECRHKANGLKMRLAEIQLRYAQGRKLLQCTEQLTSNYGRPLTAKQLGWMEDQRYQASKKIGQGSIGLQKKLSLQIEALEAEAGIYEREISNKNAE